jgi:hypothetical protein
LLTVDAVTNWQFVLRIFRNDAPSFPRHPYTAQPGTPDRPMRLHRTSRHLSRYDQIAVIHDSELEKQ